MSQEKFCLMDGRLHVYRRENSRFWQCSTYLGGRNHRQTTGEENAALAKEFARDWYLDRCADDRRRRRGLLPALPDMSTPYKMSGKISHRAWFSPEEYKALYQASRERARNPKRERW